MIRNFCKTVITMLAITMMAVSNPAQAQTNVTPNLGTTVPGSFTVDRYAPTGFTLTNGFQGRNNVLEISITSATNSANRPGGQQGTFYNTQGMKTDVSTVGSWSFQSDIWIESYWNNTQRGIVRSDMWATATDDPATSNPSAYPIVGFTNYGGTGIFRGYDVNTGLWMNFGNAVNFGSWNTMAMAFDAGTNTFSYYINGALAGSVLGTPPATTGVSDVMYQAYNFNDPALGISGNPDYMVRYSNTPNDVVPEPATMTLLATGLAGMAATRRKKKQA